MYMIEYLAKNPCDKFIATPLIFMDILKNFIKLIRRKKRQVLEMLENYKNGLDKIDDTATEVTKLQSELEIMSPKLTIAIKVVTQIFQ